jgi:hypothetical protein
MLLRSELLDDRPYVGQNSASKNSSQNVHLNSVSERILRFRVPVKSSVSSTPFAVSPVGQNAQGAVVPAKRPQRKISKSPFKVLDAPSLQDDFYLNLVDWSSNNILAVGSRKSRFCCSFLTWMFPELGWARLLRLSLVGLYFESHQTLRPNQRK